MARTTVVNQVAGSRVLDAPLEKVWEILTDNSVLAQWADPVNRVESQNSRMEVGSTRRCHVTIDGDKGYLVERCTGLVPMQSVEHELAQDSFGLGHMFTRYVTSVELEVTEESKTNVTIHIAYQPKKIFARLTGSEPMRQRRESYSVSLLAGLDAWLQAAPA